MNNVRSVFIRKRGTKYNVYVEYLDEDGKVRQKSYGSHSNKKMAEKQRIELKNQINFNKFSIPSNISFTDRCLKYYYDKADNYSPKTMQDARNTILRYVKPYFGDLPLSEITVSIYQGFVNDIYKNKKLQKGTCKCILEKTNATLNEAYRLREISEKIPDFILIPTKDEISSEKIEFYSVDEIKSILEACKDTRLELPLNLAIYGGLRFGEIAGLKWENINWENKTMHIKNNLVFADGKFHLRTTKNKEDRTLSIPDTLYKLLKKESVYQKMLKLEGLLDRVEFPGTICLNHNFMCLKYPAYRSSYSRLLKRNNIRYVKPHSLRHSHAALLIAQGIDIKTISARLGHNDIKTTMNVYAYILKGMDTKAAEAVEEILL